MTSSNLPKEGENNPPNKEVTPGSFLSAQMKNEVRKKPRAKESPNRTNQEQKVALSVNLLNEVNATIVRVEKMQRYSSEMVPAGTFEGILDELTVCKSLLESKKTDSIETYFEAVSNIIRSLDEIDEDIAIAANDAAASADRLEAELEEVKEKQKKDAEQLQKIKKLFPLMAEYNLLGPSISRIQNATTVITPLKNTIITSYEELDSFTNIQATETMAEEKSLEEINEILTRFTVLQQQVQESLTLIDQHETQERHKKLLIEKMKEATVTFDSLLTDADTLHADSATKTELQKQETLTREAKNNFDKTLSQESFDAFSKSLAVYESLVSKAKNLTIPVPSFLVKTIHQTQTSPQEKDDTSIDGLEGSWGDGYTIEIGNKKVPIKNHKIPGTLLRYEDIKKKAIKRSVDLSGPESLKNSILEALRNGDFKEATDKIHVLRKELDIIVEEKLSTPKNIASASHRYVRSINNAAYKNQDFLVATKLNNDIIRAVEEGDIVLATEKAKALRKELQNIEALAMAETKISSVSTSAQSNPDHKQAQPEDPDSTKYEGKVRKGPSGLQIEINGEFKDIPKPVTTAIFRYKFALTKYKGDELTAARVHKDALLKNVSAGDFESAIKNAQALEEELKKINSEDVEGNDQERLRNAPVGQIISLLTKKRTENSGKDSDRQMFDDLDAWEHTWLASKTIDTFRKKNGNISITDEQIATTKQLFYTYIKILKSKARSRGLTGDLLRSVPQNIIICVKILAGIHHDSRSDIKYLVENYNEEQAKTFIKRLEKILSDDSETEPEQEPSSTNSDVKTLRSKVQTVPPSSNTTEKNFEERKKVLQDTNERLEKIIPYLTSELEKKAFTKLSHDLQILQEEINQTPTKQLYLLFNAKIDQYIRELTKKEKFIIAQYGEASLSGSFSNTPSNATVIRNKRLRGKEEKEEKAGDWKARQDTDAWIKEAQNKIKNLSSTELKEKHARMFERDPILYKHIYGKESSVRDQKTDEIAKKQLENKPSIKTPKELLAELIQERDELENRWKNLYQDITNGTAFGNPEGEKKILRARIELLNERIQLFTKIVLNEITKHPSQLGREVYSPAQDASLNDSTRGIGRNYEFNEQYQPVKINRELLTEKEILELGNEKTQLSGSLYPNHTEGMVSSLTEEETKNAQGAYRVQPGAKENEQVFDEAVEKEPEAVSQETVVNQEAQKERHTFVNKLSTWLFGYPSTKKYAWGILAAGLSTFAATTGAVHFANSKTVEPKENRTLEDEIKNVPSWRTFIPESVSRLFVENFYGPKEKSFEEFIKTNAPSFVITDANPATKDKIAKLLCKNVYDIEGAGGGLTYEQQKECANLIKNMQEILKAAKAHEGILYEQDARLFGDLTIREFYEQVRKVAASSDVKEENVRKI